MHNLNIHLQESNRQLQKAIEDINRCNELKDYPMFRTTLVDKVKTLKSMTMQIEQKSAEIKKIVQTMIQTRSNELYSTMDSA